MINARKELKQKLDRLSTEQLDSVCQFVEFLQYRQEPMIPKNSITNKDIDRVFASYRHQKEQRPVTIVRNKFVVPEEFSEPLSDEVLDLFEP